MQARVSFGGRSWTAPAACCPAQPWLRQQIQHAAAGMSQPPVVVSPYDAELFGHWWFEGPMFLDFLFRKMFFD